MKSICIIIVAVIVLFGIATHSMHRNQANPYADQIIGSWVMYEGGNVAPEVLSFFANGSGYSYMLSEEFVETDQPPIHIASSFLSTPLSFTWNIQTDVLCVMFEDGTDMQYSLSIESDSNRWPVLSLQYDIGSGGWVPALIIKQHEIELKFLYIHPGIIIL